MIHSDGIAFNEKKEKPSKISFSKTDKGACCIIEEYVNKILMVFSKQNDMY